MKKINTLREGHWERRALLSRSKTELRDGNFAFDFAFRFYFQLYSTEAFAPILIFTLHSFYAKRMRLARGEISFPASFEQEQERRSQFCATSMSRMSSIAGAFRLLYTANDRYPDARIMNVSVARRTPRMWRIIVMRDGPPMMHAPHVSRKPFRLFILLMRMIIKRGRNLALLPVKKSTATSRAFDLIESNSF